MIKDKALRDEIVTQSLREIVFNRTYKQGKIGNWQKSEDMYYGKKVKAAESRANVDLGRMQEFVHSLQSKVDNQKIFKYLKRKEAQLKRVNRLNALREVDQNNDDWDMKILVGGKQLIIYGREIYNYYADSIDGCYMPHLSNVDVYDYLIDPSGGGIDIEKAMNMGDYGVVLTRDELEKGIKGKDRIYLLNETQEILDGTGNNTETTQEDTNKRNRMYGQNTIGSKELQNDDKFKFWRWFTTYKGVRYYLVLQEGAGRAIRVEKLEDLFTPTKYYKKGAWPYWTAAAFPDLTEFWTPSFCDYVREMFMVQNVAINQAVDNGEAINKPMRIVNVGAIEDLAKLKYRRDGIIPTKGDFEASRVIQELRPASIDTPFKLFDKIEAIQEKASGVSAASKGAADVDGKVGIVELNQEETQSRFDLLNRSRAFGMTRFARLYEIGVRDHLSKKVAVDMIGPDGVETEEVSRRDIFRKGDDFGLIIESSNSESLAATKKQIAKVNFINAELANPVTGKLINPKKALEIKAKVIGISDDELKQLMDTSEFGNANLMSEAERDLESLIDGDEIKPNQAANNAYKQKIKDWLVDHEEDLTDEQFVRITAYVDILDPIIMRNEARALNNFETKMMEESITQPPINGEGAVSEPLINNPVPEIANDRI